MPSARPSSVRRGQAWVCRASRYLDSLSRPLSQARLAPFPTTGSRATQSFCSSLLPVSIPPSSCTTCYITGLVLLVSASLPPPRASVANPEAQIRRFRHLKPMLWVDPGMDRRDVQNSSEAKTHLAYRLLLVGCDEREWGCAAADSSDIRPDLGPIARSNLRPAFQVASLGSLTSFARSRVNRLRRRAGLWEREPLCLPPLPVIPRVFAMPFFRSQPRP